MMTPAWETLDLTEDFADLPIEQQRDELAAAVGLLVEFSHEAMRHSSGVRWPLMPDTLQRMAARYGPWSR